MYIAQIKIVAYQIHGNTHPKSICSNWITIMANELLGILSRGREGTFEFQALFSMCAVSIHKKHHWIMEELAPQEFRT